MTIQQEVGDWHRQHFPNVTLTNIVLKTLEESGELAKAHEKHLALRQGINKIPICLDSAEKDAVGDIAISLLALCDRCGESFESILTDVWNNVKQRSPERVKNGV